MDSMEAYMRAQASRGKPLKVFDWNRAAQIIAERKPIEAVAGLASDLEWTAGVIWSAGRPNTREESYTYLASVWAIPVLIIEDEEIECWVYQQDTPGWDAHTFWPESAVEIVTKALN